jgi:hypothetical protein
MYIRARKAKGIDAASYPMIHASSPVVLFKEKSANRSMAAFTIGECEPRTNREQSYFAYFERFRRSGIGSIQNADGVNFSRS